MKNKFLLTLTLTLIAFAGTAHAASHVESAKAAASTASAAELTDGEVRKVDMGARKLTIRHGELKNLGMPGMTMVFQVNDPAMLDKVKQGDKVRFTADKIGGAFTVTSTEPAK